jgi:hypothetical protein
MTRREREDNQMWLTLLAVSLIVAACLAWIAPVIDMLALNLRQGGGASTASTETLCGYCGVIEEVREFEPTASRHGISAATGGHAGLAMIILGALGGNFRIDPVKIYQVEVRMQDGSVRTFQSTTAPARKTGDRVKVVRGRIEQVS